MLSTLVLTFNIFCFAFVSLASPTETSHPSSSPGYQCGFNFFEEKYLIDLVKVSAKTHYRGHIDFGGQVFQVPIPDFRYSNFIIVDGDDEIVSVISADVIDSSVDSSEDGKRRKSIFLPQITYKDYRTCEERPKLSSVSDPVGGYKCGGDILRSKDAIKAAYSARKMYKRNRRHWLTYVNPWVYPRAYFGDLLFSRRKPEYTFPVTAEGNFDPDGQIFIALDANFNVIGAILKKPRSSTSCSQITNIEPKIIKYGPDIEENTDRYECYHGTVTTSLVLLHARQARVTFTARERSSAMEYPKIYQGSFFPQVMEPLYYIPIFSIQGQNIHIVLTRSCDVAGVIQESATGFRLCAGKSKNDLSRSISNRRTHV